MFLHRSVVEKSTTKASTWKWVWRIRYLEWNGSFSIKKLAKIPPWFGYLEKLLFNLLVHQNWNLKISHTKLQKNSWWCLNLENTWAYQCFTVQLSELAKFTTKSLVSPLVTLKEQSVFLGAEMATFELFASFNNPSRRTEIEHCWTWGIKTLKWGKTHMNETRKEADGTTRKRQLTAIKMLNRSCGVAD